MMKLTLLVVSILLSFSVSQAFEVPSEACVVNFLQKYEDTKPYRYDHDAFYSKAVMEYIKNYSDSIDWKYKILKSIHRANRSVNVGVFLKEESTKTPDIEANEDINPFLADQIDAIEEFTRKNKKRENKPFPTPTNIMKTLFETPIVSGLKWNHNTDSPSSFNNELINFKDETGNKVTIPMGMKYLAMVESNLDPTVIGTSYERGIWQFLPRIATVGGGLIVRKLKTNRLQCNQAEYDECFQCMYDAGTRPNDPKCIKCYKCKEPYVDTEDERIDIRRSTEAFVRTVHEVWNKFKDWELVVAGWNAGWPLICMLLNEEGVAKSNCSEYREGYKPSQIDFSLVNEIWNTTIVNHETGKVRKRLPYITKMYVAKFYATAFLFNYVQNRDLCKVFDPKPIQKPRN